MPCALSPLVWAPLSELMGRRLPLLLGMFGFRCVSRVASDAVLDFALPTNNVMGRPVGCMNLQSRALTERLAHFIFVCLIIRVHIANSTGNDPSSIYSR
jgi:hypothetical protein